MPVEKAPILVTGAAGFIGYHLAQRLLDSGQGVHGFDNLNAYYDVRLKEARLASLAKHEKFSFTRGDIADAALVRKTFSELRPAYVLHMAAQAGVRHSLDQPHDYISSNIEGFLSILEGCRSFPVKHLLYASSSSVYGGNKKIPFSEHDGADHPVSLYAATKRSNELMAHSYAHLFNLPATALRFFTVYGPWGRPDMALFKFTQAILLGEPIELFNRGKMRRDFTYIDDAAEAVVRLIDQAPRRGSNAESENDPASSQAPFRILNIGSHAPVDLELFVSLIEKEVGRPAIRSYQPIQPGDVPLTYADISELKQVIGSSPSTCVEEGVKRFVAWYRAYYRV